MSWPEQWNLGVKYLDIYRRARIVYTSRLHVLLPCLAMGTSVVHTGDRRFSLLGSVDSQHVLEMDPSPLRQTYLDFLRDALGMPLVEHDPVFPQFHPADPKRTSS